MPLDEHGDLCVDYSELKHFVGSQLHKDFVLVMNRRLEAIQRDQNDVNKTITLEALRHLQGERAQVEFCRDFFTTMLRAGTEKEKTE